MNWGSKIAILYCSFAGLIITMVFMSMSQQVDMVTPDYYEQELAYQDHINTVNRTAELGEQLILSINDNKMTLAFPRVEKGKTISGSLYFFRPSDQAFDKTLSLSPDTALVRTISLEQLNPGFFKLQVKWRSGDKNYYNEFNIHL